MCSGGWTGPLPLSPFHPNLQALVYDILPRWCSNGSKFVTVNSNYICLTTHAAYASTNKIKIVCIETELGFFFLPRADAPRVYVRACMLCCFHGLIRGPIHTPCIAFLHLSPRKEGCRKPVLGVWDLYYTWRSMVFLVPKPFGARWHHRSRAKEYPFNGVTNILAEFGGRCRKYWCFMPSQPAWLHLGEEGAGKRCSECAHNVHTTISTEHHRPTFFVVVVVAVIENSSTTRITTYNKYITVYFI